MLQMYVMYIKSMLHRKRFYLWNLLFPVVFATLLFVVVDHLTVLEDFHSISVGMVLENPGEEYNNLLSAMKLTKTSNGVDLFEVIECEKEEGMRLLQANEMKACVVVGDSIQLYISENGLTQSMIKSYLDQYEQFLKIYNLVDDKDKSFISIESLDHVWTQGLNVTNEMSQLRMDNSILYFYTLIGMCCLMAVGFGFYLADLILPNKSVLAARMYCTPVGIFRRFFSGILASITVALFELIVVMCFIKYILGCELLIEKNTVWAVVVVGLLVGTLFGYFLSGMIKNKTTWRQPIVMSIIIVSSFFAGLVRMDVKYYVEQKFPVLAYINPVNLVSDAFYSLFYQENFMQYVLNLCVLVVFAVLLLIGSLVLTGRRAYDCI